jgi:xyloglucan-specific exo-beta-1,4-glucanase
MTMRSRLLLTIGVLSVIPLGACCPCRYGDRTNTPAGVSGGDAGSTSVTLAPYRWKSVIILGGGFVTGIIFSPAEKDLIYARTDIGGAYRWEPKDSTWRPITDMFGPDESNFLGIDSLIADPKDPNRVYMAVGTYTATWATEGAIMRSSDRGETWEKTAMPIKMGGNENGRSTGERLAVDPNDTKVIYFGSRRAGLWRSTDRGESFSELKSFPVKDEEKGIGITFVSIDDKSGNPGKATPRVYAGYASLNGPSLYRSEDAGASWQPVPGQPSGVMPSHGDFDKEGVLYLSYGDGPGPGELTTGSVWKYVAKGDAWTNITPLAPSENDKFGYGGLATNPTKSGVLMVTSLDRWAKGDEIWRSENGGKSWKAIGPNVVRDHGGAKYLYWDHKDPSATGWMGEIALDPFDDSRAMYVTGQGIWASHDAHEAWTDKPTHWRFTNRGLEECAVTDVASPPTGVPLLSAVGDLGGFRHENLDEAPAEGMFQNPIFGSGSSLDFAEKKPDLLVRVGQNDKKDNGAVSYDQGKTWKPFAKQIGGWGGQIAISADGATIVWSPKDGLALYSADLGASWTPAVGLPAPAKAPDWASVALKIAADRVNPKKFYAYSSQDGQALVSTNGGANFEVTYDAMPTLPEYETHFGHIETPFGVEGEVWVTTGKELYRSKDSGKHFDTVDSVEKCNAVGFGKAAPGKTHPAVFISGTVNGVFGFYRSDDEGKTMNRINDDRHQYGGSAAISGDPRIFGRVYVGTHGRGILYADPK